MPDGKEHQSGNDDPCTPGLPHLWAGKVEKVSACTLLPLFFFRLSQPRDEVNQECMGRHSRFGALSWTESGRRKGKKGAVAG